MKVLGISIAVSSFLIASTVGAAVLIVDQGGGSETFLKIQDALNHAVDGDEIIVYPGTYVENVDFLGKEVWLHSAFGAEQTIIDGGAGQWPNLSCATFRSSETSQTVMEGFRLQNGRGNDFAGSLVGGGSFCLDSSPLIRGCEFVANAAQYAAAIYVRNGGPTISGCVFRSNIADTYGGAIAGANGQTVTVTDCLFEDNFAGSGDGTVHFTSDAVIEDCIFRGNRARAGAAVNSPSFGADFIVRNCTFEENRAHGTHGGAIRAHESSPTIEFCLFVNNWAALDGGAILTIDGGQPKIRNCTFYHNSSGRNGGSLAFWSDSSPDISSCIIANTEAHGGVFCSGAYPDFTCNDAWNNSGGNYTGGCSDPTGFEGNISANPLFCAPEANNFMLQAGSPCAPENNPECGLIGAFGVGCASTGVGDQDVARSLKLVIGPNPFSAALEFRLMDPRTLYGDRVAATLEIFSPSGRRVWSTRSREIGVPIIWDGRDESGYLVSSGVYYVRLTQDGTPMMQRTIVRVD
jgi:hypothetical protein